MSGMANTVKGPNKTQLKAYLSQGMTQQQIVEAWAQDSGVRVARSTIAMLIERSGLESANPRPRYDELLPWRVAPEHRDDIDARALRLEGRRRAGGKITPWQEKWLEGWIADLRNANAVVHYDRATEKGFHWIPRTPEHGDDLIHRPKVRGGSAADIKMDKRKDP